MSSHISNKENLGERRFFKVGKKNLFFLGWKDNLPNDVCIHIQFMYRRCETAFIMSLQCQFIPSGPHSIFSAEFFCCYRVLCELVEKHSRSV